MKRPEAQKVRAIIAIADKTPIVRDGIVEIISRDGRFDPVIAVSTGRAFLKAANEQPVDVGVIGWSFPDMTGRDILRELRRRKMKIRIVIYSGEPSDRILPEAIPLGAWGFASKRIEPSHLLEVIAAVASGRSSFSQIDLQAAGKNPLHTLTERERDLLSALANGWSNQRIAEHFRISRNTVKFHLKNLYDKLDVDNRTMAIGLIRKNQSDKR